MVLNKATFTNVKATFRNFAAQNFAVHSLLVRQSANQSFTFTHVYTCRRSAHIVWIIREWYRMCGVCIYGWQHTVRAEDLTVQSESSKSAMSPLITRALPVLLASSPTAVAAAALTSLAISRMPVYAEALAKI
jgi:hypothetical protein